MFICDFDESMCDWYITHMLEVWGLNNISMTVEHEGLVFSLVYGHPIAKGNPPDGWRDDIYRERDVCMCV